MAKLFHVPSEEFSAGTAQTAGMMRLAALSGESVGSRALWMGQTHVAPGVASGVQTKPGDYIYIPPFVHHVESNSHSEEEAVVVIARTTQEAIVENLDQL